MYLPIRPGLFDAKHLKQMGMAVWLYGYLHSRVKFKGDGAGCTFPRQPYTHGEAAAALGVSRETVRDWFQALVKGEYITAQRQGNALSVTVCKYGNSGVEPPHLEHNSGVQPPGGWCAATTRSGVQPPPEKSPTRSAREKLDTRVFTLEVQIPFTGDAASAPQNAARSEPEPVRAVPKPNRYGEVIDAIRGRGLDYDRDDRDAAAVKRSALAPALIAEVYDAIARGLWGDDFDRKRLSVHHAIASWNAYRSARALPAAPGRRKEGSSANSRVDRVFAEQGIFDEPSYGGGHRRPDPQVGYGEAGDRVPRQLLG